MDLPMDLPMDLLGKVAKSVESHLLPLGCLPNYNSLTNPSHPSFVMCDKASSTVNTPSSSSS